jgi:hypothetical protein
MMDQKDFVDLVRQAYDRLIRAGRHQLRYVHLKDLFQEMKLLHPSLKLPEFKSQLADLNSKDFQTYRMDRGSIINPATARYGIIGEHGMRAYFKLEETTKQ